MLIPPAELLAADCSIRAAVFQACFQARPTARVGRYPCNRQAQRSLLACVQSAKATISTSRIIIGC